MENIRSVLFPLPIFFLTFALVTFFWWNISRRFFIFLFYFSETTLEFQKDSWKYTLFNYVIFGPLALINIFGYMYTLFVFFKFLQFTKCFIAQCFKFYIYDNKWAIKRAVPVTLKIFFNINHIFIFLLSPIFRYNFSILQLTPEAIYE